MGKRYRLRNGVEVEQQDKCNCMFTIVKDTKGLVSLEKITLITKAGFFPTGGYHGDDFDIIEEIYPSFKLPIMSGREKQLYYIIIQDPIALDIVRRNASTGDISLPNTFLHKNKAKIPLHGEDDYSGVVVFIHVLKSIGLLSELSDYFKKFVKDRAMQGESTPSPSAVPNTIILPELSEVEQEAYTRLNRSPTACNIITNYIGEERDTWDLNNLLRQLCVNLNIPNRDQIHWVALYLHLAQHRGKLLDVKSEILKVHAEVYNAVNDVLSLPNVKEEHMPTTNPLDLPPLTDFEDQMYQVLFNEYSANYRVKCAAGYMDGIILMIMKELVSKNRHHMPGNQNQAIRYFVLFAHMLETMDKLHLIHPSIRNVIERDDNKRIVDKDEDEIVPYNKYMGDGWANSRIPTRRSAMIKVNQLSQYYQSSGLQPPTKEEIPMKTFTVTHSTFVNGYDVKTRSKDNLISDIREAEAAIADLKAIKVTSKTISSEVDKLTTFIKEVVELLDKKL